MSAPSPAPVDGAGGALPVLGLVLTGSGADLVPLLAAMRRWCRPVARRRGSDAGPPVALLHDAVPEHEPDLPWAVVSRHDGVLAAAGAHGVPAPDGQIPVGSAFVPPFVRERLRHVRGLGGPAVLRRDEAGWWWAGRPEPLAAELVPTALGACAAVALHGDDDERPQDLATALAWGAPVAAGAGLVARSGVVAGRDVMVAATGVDVAAGVLADDPRTASRLAWNGYRWWQERHDAAWVAADLALRLLPATGLAAELRLAALGTPADAEIRDRWLAARL